MGHKIKNIAVQIVRFVDERVPGWVECEFTDAGGRVHRFIDKVPVFTSEMVWTDSAYPRPGAMECGVLASWRDADGMELSRISTADPEQSGEGLSEFVVLSSQVPS
jgi:hypothetical protein